MVVFFEVSLAMDATERDGSFEEGEGVLLSLGSGMVTDWDFRGCAAVALL